MNTFLNNTPLQLARQVLAAAETELAALYRAQAEDVVAVTITTRSGKPLTVPVNRKKGFNVCAQLIAASEARVSRLKVEALRQAVVDGTDAAIELKNLERHHAA